MIRLVALAVASAASFNALADCPSLYIYDVMNRPAYRQAYAAMVQTERGLPQWMSTPAEAARATGSPAVKQRVGNDEREVFKICEPHNCGGHIFIVAFTEFDGPAFGLLSIDGHKRYLGHPSAGQRRALTAMDDSAP